MVFNIHQSVEEFEQIPFKNLENYEKETHL